MQNYTMRDFERNFPTDEACLDWLKNYLYPDGIFCGNCGKITKHHRVASRLSYSCDYCGHHVHPMAGTIYEKSTTPLRSWFYATFLLSSTRCGISAKQLQRELGVTYKTAWRMFHQIRTLLLEDGAHLSGSVEVDETYVGGKHPGKRGRGAAGKTPVFGMAQRGGRVVATVVPDVQSDTLKPIIQSHVEPSSVVYSDELASYDGLAKVGYVHHRVNHSAKQYVVGKDIHTNTIEGFWSQLKRSIDGTYHHVSGKWLPSYVAEYGFRYSHRDDERPMFTTVLQRVVKS